MLLATGVTVCSADNILNLAKTYTTTNKLDTVSNVFVSTATIIPGVSRIVSLTVMPTDGSALSPYATIYDGTSTADFSDLKLLAEVEAPAQTSADKLFVYPKNVSKGLGIVIGPKTIVIIEYTR
jgi:hypothetical protein